jgi:hypothetical protein
MFVSSALYRYARPLMGPGPLRAALLFILATTGTIVILKALVRLPFTRYLA